MEDFPKLNDRQVALLRADVDTGHVLDEKFELVIADDQQAYTIFEDAGAALSYAKALVAANVKVECVVYGRDREVLCHIRPENAANC